MISQRFSCLILFCFLFNLAVEAQPQQGQPAKEIALPTVNGDTIRLSSLRGKIVLLDFWASWCKPCRMSNRNLQKTYAKYKGKGFEIYGVSLDDDSGDWQKAIKEDKVSWLQVNEPGGWRAKTAMDWDIMAIPTSYLIGKDGRLIAMDLDGKRLEKALKSLLDK